MKSRDLPARRLAPPFLCTDASGADDAVFRPPEHDMDRIFREAALFGADSRVEAMDAEEPWRTLARGVPVLVNFWSVSTLHGVSTLSGTPYGSADRIEPRTRFYGQPKVGRCSGALIAPDLVLTAGHCISPGNCASTRFVFDFFFARAGAGAGAARAVPPRPIPRSSASAATGGATYDAAIMPVSRFSASIEAALRAPRPAPPPVPAPGTAPLPPSFGGRHGIPPR